MCVIIHKPLGVQIDEKYLKEGFYSNMDGYGILSLDRQNAHQPITVQKGLGSYKKFFKAFRKVKDKELVIHFRIKTHGVINIENAHPVPVTEGVWLAHNGVLKNVEIFDEKVSDTRHLASLLKPWVDAFPNILHDDSFRKTLGDKIGSNKLVFADKDGVYFVNRALGVERDGCWFSNTSAFPVAKTTYFGYDDQAWGEPFGAFSHVRAARSIDTGIRPAQSYEGFSPIDAFAREDLPWIYSSVKGLKAHDLYEEVKDNPDALAFLLHCMLTDYSYNEYLDERQPSAEEEAEIAALTEAANEVQEQVAGWNEVIEA